MSAFTSGICLCLTEADVSSALRQVVPTAMRGGLQSCGQNCAGAERFIVAAPLFDEFTASVVATAQKLRQVLQILRSRIMQCIAWSPTAASATPAVWQHPYVIVRNSKLT